MTGRPGGVRPSQIGNEPSAQRHGEALAGQWVRLGLRKVVQEFLAAEVSEVLGRGPHERVGSGKGYRNGYKTRWFVAAASDLEIAVPQVRGLGKPFRSELWRRMRRRTDVLERLGLRLLVGALSSRDIERALREIGDGRRLLSRASVNCLTTSLRSEYKALGRRELGGYDVVHLCGNAIWESFRRQAGLQQSVLATWAVLGQGDKVLLDLQLGNQESPADWLKHLRNLVRRGLSVPRMVSTGSAPGLITAAEAIWPEAERIRWRAQTMDESAADRVPKETHARRKA